MGGNTNGYGRIITRRYSSQNSAGWEIKFATGRPGRLIFFDPTFSELVTDSDSVKLFEWQHIAIVKSGSNVGIYINGAFACSPAGACVSTSSMTDSSQGLRLGIENNGEGTEFKGFMDELRISKGIAWWTAPFTPPTAPFAAE